MTTILSIDGGGIRGIIPAYILVHLEKALQYHSQRSDARIAEYFDLTAGTSTGGILTALYLLPDATNPLKPRFSAENALDFYIHHGHEIFTKSFGQSLRSLWGLIGPKYSPQALEKLLLTYLGSTKLSELLTPCLIPAFDLTNNNALFFNQLDPLKAHKEDFFVRQLIRATTAAPTYFPVAEVSSLKNKSYSLVDGGVFANNPTLCAYVEINKLTPQPIPSDISIFSLGTGMDAHHFNIHSLAHAGILQWALPLFNIMMSSSSETVEHTVRLLFDSLNISQNYLRIQPNFTTLGYPDIPMDAADPKSINTLLTISSQLAKDYAESIDAFANYLVSLKKQVDH